MSGDSIRFMVGPRRGESSMMKLNEMHAVSGPVLARCAAGADTLTSHARGGTLPVVRV
jgi:hypothetical protein